MLSTPRKVAGKIAGYVFDVELDPSRERITSKEVIHQWRENGTLTPNTVKKLSNTTKLQKPGHYVIELEARMGGRPWLYQKLPCRYLPPLEASLRPIPSRSVIGTRLRLHGADPDERGKVRIDFQDDEGTVALSHEAAVDGNELQLELPMKDLRPGDYKASFELWDTKGRKIWTATQPFRKWDTPEWLKNRKALEALESDWVPAPWRPVRTTGGQVSLWGRRISFGRGTFISQIESQSVPLLSDAAQIHYSAKGKEHRIKISESVIQMKGQGRAIATQQGNSPNFALSVKHTIEFDGMHRIDLSLRPKQRGKIESLWIDLPFRESKYLFFSSQKGLRSSAWQAGLFPERGRSEPDFYKWIWLGNDRVGCCLFVENYKGWLVNSTKPRISLESHGKTKRLRLLLVNEPSEILKPVQITFGLMATPVKPFFKGWRSMRAQGLNIGERPGNLSLASPDYWNAHYSRPSPRNWRALNDMVNYAHGRGQRVYPYIGLLYISPFEYIRKDFGFSDFSNGGFPEGVAVNRTAEAARLEEYFYYKADWDLSPPSVSMPARETRAEARLTPASSYSDYFVHGVYEMLTKSDIDGYFFDIDNPMLDRNTTKGHLYRTKDGNEEGTYELFAIRDLYKRIYYLFEKYRGPERKPYILGHGFAMSAPYMSFWDAAVNGEEIKP
ncbi:MAG: DUF6067 family protein, partial [Planctomycetota bacterium]|nr:DUF6067 family protein [Planctomycetota bacterium]